MKQHKTKSTALTLSKLHPGDHFTVDGRAGELLYVSECRARVRWAKTEHDAVYEDNVAPGTAVEVVG